MHRKIDRIDTKAIDAAIEPKAHDVEQRVLHGHEARHVLGAQPGDAVRHQPLYALAQHRAVVDNRGAGAALAIKAQHCDVGVDVDHDAGQAVALAVAQAEASGAFKRERHAAQGQGRAQATRDQRPVQRLFRIQREDAHGDGRGRVVAPARHEGPAAVHHVHHRPGAQARREVERIAVEPGVARTHGVRQILAQPDDQRRRTDDWSGARARHCGRVLRTRSCWQAAQGLAAPDLRPLRRQVHGVAAQLDFHYLAPWLMQQLRQGGEPEPLDAAAWPWRVYELLAHPRLLREHPRLAHSLGDPAAPTAERLRWERAAAIAARLEGLGLERPDWLAAWRERRLLLDHPDEAWMAALWRAVGDDSADRLARQLPRLRSAPGGRPVHLFAPARLAPLHLQALAALGEARDIHLYVLNPCREYWFDLLSPRRLARLQALGRADASHETLHPLLAHWAAPSQQLLRQLAALEWHADGGDYRDPARPTLLAEVQRSLLDLGPMPQGPLRAGDRSLELHRCHSLRRQLEVLHDRLLDLFTSDPSLQLGDVLVLLPELDAAAPLIDAVFGSAPAPLALPYSLSGQSRPPLPPRVDAFVRVLALLQGPAPAGEVWALCSAFGLDEDDEDGAAREQALQSAGHHAGLGQARAAAQGLSAAHSLEAALQRLLLAHCLPDAPRQMPLGRWRAAPQRLAAGELAALQGFARTLIAAEGAAAQPLPAPRWCAWLLALVQALLPDTGDPDGAPAEAARQLREAIAKLDVAWRAARLSQALPLARVHAALLDALHDPARGGVAGGAISFSTLAALRALPARVVDLAGQRIDRQPHAERRGRIGIVAGGHRAHHQRLEAILAGLVGALDRVEQRRYRAAERLEHAQRLRQVGQVAPLEGQVAGVTRGRGPHVGAAHRVDHRAVAARALAEHAAPAGAAAAVAGLDRGHQLVAQEPLPRPHRDAVDVLVAAEADEAVGERHRDRRHRAAQFVARQQFERERLQAVADRAQRGLREGQILLCHLAVLCNKCCQAIFAGFPAPIIFIRHV